MRRRGRGFSLIELVIVMAIVGVLLAFGASGFSVWIANMRVRGAAEAILAGLQLARAEAVRRNERILFTLTSSVDNGCTSSTSDANWVVSFDDPAAKCASAPLKDAFSASDGVNNPAPRIIQVRSAAEGSRGAAVAADQASFSFNGLGRLTATPATNPVVINVSNPAAGTCVADGGKIRCLRVTVTLGGQLRLCDPAYTSSGTDPQRCP